MWPSGQTKLVLTKLSAHQGNKCACNGKHAQKWLRVTVCHLEHDFMTMDQSGLWWFFFYLLSIWLECGCWDWTSISSTLWRTAFCQTRFHDIHPSDALTHRGSLRTSADGKALKKWKPAILPYFLKMLSHQRSWGKLAQKLKYRRRNNNGDEHITVLLFRSGKSAKCL